MLNDKEVSLACRVFNWGSARDPSMQSRLRTLSEKMIEYYSIESVRRKYQDMLAYANHSQPAATERLCSLVTKFSTVAELGCGSGWLLGEFKKKGLHESNYFGAEFSNYVIEQNKKSYPSATWVHLVGYESRLEDGSVDCSFSNFVLEHCVFPEQHLSELLRITKAGGSSFIVCPDFQSLRIVASQYMGLLDVNAGELMLKGRVFSALIQLFDSRIRLPFALQRLRERYGAFVVNMSPKCLSYPDVVRPDVDAVYIATREDLMVWASEKGVDCLFHDHGISGVIVCELRKK